MEQIEQAVMYALGQGDPGLKAQANAYCEQVKDSADGWQLCMQLFIKEPKAMAEARFFALQVLDNTLINRFDSLDSNQIEFIKQTMMEYFHKEFTDNTSSSEETFIRNKTAQSLTLLFKHIYPTIWPNFFKDMVSLIQNRQVKAIDFFLRLCISIDEEIARVDIPRTREDVVRNTTIKDTMRLGDIQLLVSVWFELVQEYKSSNPLLAQLALKNMGIYTAWMDISLVANEQVMNVLYELLSDQNLRIASCECITDIISKGMQPLDKLSMLQMFNITEILKRLDLSESEFVEVVARLINAFGVELCKIYNEPTLPAEGKTATWSMFEQIAPYLLKLLANENNDISTTVFFSVNDMLSILKKQKKNMQTLTQGQYEFLASLLNVLITKLKYDEDTEWGADQEDTEEDEFVNLRKSLGIFIEHIAAIQEELFISCVHSLMMDTFKKSSAELNWRDVELSLYVLYCSGEALSKNSLQYILPNGNLTPLGELVSEMVASNISAYPHPSAPMQYFENISRYYQFFEQRPEQLPQVLESFVDARGCHHPVKTIRTRCWLLFQRFTKNLKPKMGPFVDSVLGSIGDLLTIKAELPVEASSIDDVPAASVFDNQISLFESVGLLISCDQVEPEKQAGYLKIVLEPLVEGIQKYMSQRYNPEDELFILQLHHYIMAVGAVAKGFVLPKGANQSEICAIYNQATEIILNILQGYNQVTLIRNAVRFTFARLVTCLGTQVLPYLPSLINNLLTECQITELVDFLPFITLVGHTYRPGIEPIIDELLLPLVRRVYDFLNTQPSGTDEAVILVDLQKTYLNFIVSLFNSGLENVFISERNVEHLNTILQTVLHFAKDSSNSTTQKMAFGVFLKMVNSWTSQNVFVPFVYNEIIPATFTVPMDSNFNIINGQNVMVFSELASIHKTLFLKQGTEYVNYMKSVYFPSIQCPPDTAEQYCQAVQQYDNRQFKKYFQSFILEAKS